MNHSQGSNADNRLVGLFVVERPGINEKDALTAFSKWRERIYLIPQGYPNEVVHECRGSLDTVNADSEISIDQLNSGAQCAAFVSKREICGPIGSCYLYPRAQSVQGLECSLKNQ